MPRAKRYPLLAALAVAALLVAACGGGSSGGSGDSLEKDDVTSLVSGELPSDGPPEQGGILTLPDSSDSPTLDIHKSATAFTHSAVDGLVYSRLLEFTTSRELPYGSMKVRPDLAESYEHSEDGKTWTFHLRKGVTFHNVAPVNGREFTSADVACTIDRIKTLPGVQKNLVDLVSTVGTPDPYTVVFNLNTAYAAFDESMASFYMGMLPCEGTRGQYDLATTAIGTGPFVLQKWDRTQGKTYVKNPAYFVQGKPHLDGIRTVVMADPAAQLAAYRTGELDITSVTEDVLPALQSTNPDAVVRSQMALTMNHIFMNQVVKPFDDLRVRKAVAMAWDRQGMGDASYNEVLLAGPYPSTLQGGITPEESSEYIPYDPDAAKKLLAEAGFPNGFSVEMLTTSGYGPSIQNQAQWVQQDLQKIGITTTLRILDYASFFSTFQKKDYAIGYGLSTGFMTPDEWLQSNYVSTGPRNWFSVNDPKLDAMIKEQQSIVDVDERTEKLHDIGEYFMQNTLNPIMGMQYASLAVNQPYVHNYYTHPEYARGYLVDTWLDSNAPGRK